ncbi:hypothetical protein ACOMHN_013405 [Nucella lapillus]
MNSHKSQRKKLEDCTSIQERRKIRAAIREQQYQQPQQQQPQQQQPQQQKHLQQSSDDPSPYPTPSSPLPTPPTTRNGHHSLPPKLERVYRATPYRQTARHASVTSSSSSSSSSMASAASLPTRPPALPPGSAGRRGTVGALPAYPHHPAQVNGGGTTTTTTTTTAPSPSMLSLGSDRAGGSMERLSINTQTPHSTSPLHSPLSRDSRFMSASVLNLPPPANNGVVTAPSQHVRPKRHSVGHALSFAAAGGGGSSLLPPEWGGWGSSGAGNVTRESSSSSSSAASSPFSSISSTFGAAAEVPLPARIRIRRSSHVFLSDGEAHGTPVTSPGPILSPTGGKKEEGSLILSSGKREEETRVLSPGKREDDSLVLSPGKREEENDNVFVALTDEHPHDFKSSRATTITKDNHGGVGGHKTNDITSGGGSGSETVQIVQGSEAVAVRTASCLPIDQCEDEDELLDLLCTTEDIKERLKIRSRLRQLKEARQGQ